MPREESPAATPPVIEFAEAGPRDGLQNEAKSLYVSTRIEMITRLVNRGVRRLEAVSFVRADRVPQMAGAEGVMAGLPVRPGVTYIGLAQNRRGAGMIVSVTLAVAFGCPFTGAVSTAQLRPVWPRRG